MWSLGLCISHTSSTDAVSVGRSRDDTSTHSSFVTTLPFILHGGHVATALQAELSLRSTLAPQTSCVTIKDLLLRHRLSPSTSHCEDSFQCASLIESPTGAALALVLRRCYHLDTALRPIPITWKIQTCSRSGVCIQGTYSHTLPLSNP